MTMKSIDESIENGIRWLPSICQYLYTDSLMVDAMTERRTNNKQWLESPILNYVWISRLSEKWHEPKFDKIIAMMREAINTGALSLKIKETPMRGSLSFWRYDCIHLLVIRHFVPSDFHNQNCRSLEISLLLFTMDWTNCEIFIRSKISN
jgi:hypothetical protein